MYVNPEEDWVIFETEGLVYSGHATRTSFGNYNRSLIYAFHYLREMHPSFGAPWKDPRVFILISGDDTIFIIRKEWALSLKDTILSLSHRSLGRETAGIEIGLGQCIKEVNVSMDPTVFDFCSKWSFSVGNGGIENLVLTRDYKKFFRTKQAYTGDNRTLQCIPALHRRAIYEGLRAARDSKLIEDCCLA